MGYDVPMERKEESTFLADQTEELSCFVKYLESIKYLVRIEKTVGHEEGAESFIITLSKDDVSTTFSEDEFEVFCNTIKKSIAFEIFKKSEKA